MFTLKCGGRKSVEGLSSSRNVFGLLRATINLSVLILMFRVIPGIPSVSPGDVYVSFCPVGVFRVNDFLLQKVFWNVF